MGFCRMASFDHSRSVEYKPGLCEWDQIANSPAMSFRDRYIGCGNEATINAGSTGNGNFHVCESCSNLKRFARLKKRPLSSWKATNV